MKSTSEEPPVLTGPFGRPGLLDWIEFALRAPGAILALWGERRIGKTTLLRRLEEHLPSPSFLPVYFDLAGRGRRPLQQVVRDLAGAICTCLGRSAPPGDDRSVRWFHERFLPRVQHLLGEECRLVLALDHIDRLGGWAESTPGDAHAPGLVAYLQRLIEEVPHLAIVLALGPRPEDLEAEWRPLLRGARYRQVPLLEERSARTVLTAPRPAGRLRFSEPALQRALRLTAGHPHLLELLWERLYRAGLALPTPVLGPRDVDAAAEEVLDAGEGAFSWIWDSLRPPERLVLSLIAAAERRTPLTAESLEERTGLPEALGVQAALLRRELLERTPDGTLRVRSELFGRWIATHQPPDVVTEEVDLPLAEELCRLAEKCQRQQDRDNAVALLRHALKVQPGHLRARLLLDELEPPGVVPAPELPLAPPAELSMTAPVPLLPEPVPEALPLPGPASTKPPPDSRAAFALAGGLVLAMGMVVALLVRPGHPSLSAARPSPPPSPPALREGAVAQLLPLDRALLAGRWEEVIARADALLADGGLPAEVREWAAAKRQIAQQELAARAAHERLRLAVEANRPAEDLLALLAEIPEGSSYRVLARSEHRMAFAAWTRDRILRAEAARQAGRCWEFRYWLAQAAALTPEHPALVKARRRRCLEVPGTVQAARGVRLPLAGAPSAGEAASP